MLEAGNSSKLRGSLLAVLFLLHHGKNHIVYIVVLHVNKINIAV